MTYQDKLFLIKAIYPTDRVKDHNGIKDELGATLVLKQQNQMFFLEEIEEVLFTEINE